MGKKVILLKMKFNNVMADIKVSIFVRFLSSEQQISSFCFASLVVLHWEGDV